MITKEIENMDLYQIAESGQCFRWKRLDEPIPAYAIIAGSHCEKVTYGGDGPQAGG